MAPVIEDTAWQELDQNLVEMASSGKGRLVFVPNTGNAGDALIATATWQRFDKLGIQPLVIRTAQLRPGDQAIFSGGGNLVPEYHDCERFLRRCLHKDVASALILPHTIRGHAELLSLLDNRFTLFCRESSSLRWVTKVAPNANTFFAPELALGIDVAKLFGSCRERSPIDIGLASAPRQLIKYLLWKRRIGRVRPDASGHLKIIRCDVERSDDTVGDPKYDLSNLYGSPYRIREECDQISYEFLDVIARAEAIETNRLHVGIGAALLGKRVILHDNSYGKIRAVFDASLHMEKNIRFVPRQTQLPAWQ